MSLKPYLLSTYGCKDMLKGSNRPQVNQLGLSFAGTSFIFGRNDIDTLDTVIPAGCFGNVENGN